MAGKSKKTAKRLALKVDTPNVIAPASDDGVMEDVEEELVQEGDKEPENLQVYIPGMNLEEGEELEADPSTYYMLHSLTTEWPCLSFDIVRHGSNLSQEYLKYPQTAYILAGTQADRPSNNRLYLMRWSGLARTGGFTEEEEAEMAENEEEPEECKGEPVLETCEVKHQGGVNRVRVLQDGQQTLAASWSDTGKVFIYDMTKPMANFTAGSCDLKPSYTISEHETEGYSLAWSNSGKGLLSGDCVGKIVLTSQTGQSTKFMGHSQSVEDLQWSPSDPSLFASCSVDQTVRIWDNRTNKSVSQWKLADSDINVLSWNRPMPFLLATGADDGSLRVWDMRMLQSGNSSSPVAAFDWHKLAITGLEWHPTDSSIMAATGADNQLTIWDLAVEKDIQQLVQDGGKAEDEVDQVPDQLLFIHQGQSDMKELHWHPQLPGTIVSTAADSFNIFRTISV